MKEWFESWFDTKYYHMLYGNHDEKDAQEFLTNLLKERAFDKNDEILDLACGRGRHSIFLNQQGFKLNGVDLSEHSIAAAKEYENERLSFFVHNMIDPMPNRSFDFVLNLFTSFGYFENEEDNLKMLHSIHSYLKPNGELIIDFMNSIKVEKELVGSEIKEIDGISFQIERRLNGDFIEKEISFKADSKMYNFIEKVRNFELNDFEKMLNMTNFNLEKVYGNYELSEFDEKISNRLIICAKSKL